PCSPRIVTDAFGKQVGIPYYGRQQIVEVMRDSADELSHRLDFLRLQQRRLRALALFTLGPKLNVGLLQRMRALRDQAFQVFGGISLGIEVSARIVLAGAAAL